MMILVQSYTFSGESCCSVSKKSDLLNFFVYFSPEVGKSFDEGPGRWARRAGRGVQTWKTRGVVSETGGLFAKSWEVFLRTCGLVGCCRAVARCACVEWRKRGGLSAGLSFGRRKLSEQNLNRAFFFVDELLQSGNSFAQQSNFCRCIVGREIGWCKEVVKCELSMLFFGGN